MIDEKLNRMEELYKELLERKEYLESLKQTEEIKWRVAEITLAIVRVQQLLLSNVAGRSEQFICDCGKEGEYSKKFNDILCNECFDEKLAN